MAEILSPPATCEPPQCTSTLVKARAVIATMIAAVTGTVYFSNVRIR